METDRGRQRKGNRRPMDGWSGFKDEVSRYNGGKNPILFLKVFDYTNKQSFCVTVLSSF